MKASRFVKAFEQEVDKWERTLSHILEVVEMLLTVQRQWMYLEVKLNLSHMSLHWQFEGHIHYFGHIHLVMKGLLK